MSCLSMELMLLSMALIWLSMKLIWLLVALIWIVFESIWTTKFAFSVGSSHSDSSLFNSVNLVSWSSSRVFSSSCWFKSIFFFFSSNSSPCDSWRSKFGWELSTSSSSCEGCAKGNVTEGDISSHWRIGDVVLAHEFKLSVRKRRMKDAQEVDPLSPTAEETLWDKWQNKQ